MTEPCIRAGDILTLCIYTSDSDEPLLELDLEATEALSVAGKLMGLLTDRRRAVTEQLQEEPRAKTPRLVVVQ